MILASVVILLIISLLFIYFNNIDRKKERENYEEDKLRMEKERERILRLPEIDRLYELDCDNIKKKYEEVISLSKDEMYKILDDIKQNDPNVSSLDLLERKLEMLKEIRCVREEMKDKLEERRKRFFKEKGWNKEF